MPRHIWLLTRRHLPQWAKHQVILASAICDIAGRKGLRFGSLDGLRPAFSPAVSSSWSWSQTPDRLWRQSRFGDTPITAHSIHFVASAFETSPRRRDSHGRVK